MDRLECRLLLADVNADLKILMTLWNECLDKKQFVYHVETFTVMLKHDKGLLNQNNCSMALACIDSLLKLITAMSNPRTQADQKCIDDCLRFYGLSVSRYIYLNVLILLKIKKIIEKKISNC